VTEQNAAAEVRQELNDTGLASLAIVGRFHGIGGGVRHINRQPRAKYSAISRLRRSDVADLLGQGFKY
jgi:hypothetical protein